MIIADATMIRCNPQGPSLKKELYVLLDRLCGEWGFCIAREDVDRIAASESLNAGEFATAVLGAEGFNPENEVHWVRKIKRRFVEHFGGKSASAKDYRGVKP